MLFCLILSLAVSAQKIGKPTVVPTAATAAQKQLIDEGIKLHDQQKYDEAIKKYAQVLAENPNNDEALYELALSYYNKKDTAKASETAYKLIKYKSNLGILGFGFIANILDDSGKPKEAIELYQKAISQLKGDADLERHLSGLYFNLGITHYRQKQFKEAREASKTAVELNFAYPSPSYLLAVVYSGTKYKVPALLAAARLISLEQDTQRTKHSVKIFLGILGAAKKDEKTGNINIFLDLDAPKDEGDFGIYELLLGTLTTVKGEKDKSKTESEIFAEAVDTMIGLLEEDKKLKSTFIGKTYVPFMVEMKKKNFTKTFAFLVLQQNGNKEVEKWLSENNQQKLNFIDWAKSYQLKQ